jgi:hypothetical protein
MKNLMIVLVLVMASNSWGAEQNPMKAKELYHGCQLLVSLDTPHSYLTDTEMVQGQHSSGYLEGWLSAATMGVAWRVGSGKHVPWKSLILIDDLDTNQVCRAYVLYLGQHPELLNESKRQGKHRIDECWLCLATVAEQPKWLE